MKPLRNYQQALRYEINNDKSFFFTHEGIGRHINRSIRKWTRYKQSKFPFTYLSCPIYSGGKKKSYFTNISKHILNKVVGWKGKFLSLGGKAIIVKRILQS